MKRAVSFLFLMGLLAWTGPGLVRGAGDSSSPRQGKDRASVPQAAAPIPLAGQGDEVSEKIHLEGGLSTWTVTHDGRHNLQVELLNSEGQSVAMPVNEIGAFRGTLVVRVGKAGDYRVNVRADGRWTVTIQQPRPETGEAKPVAKEGQGADLACFVELPHGLTVFRVTHTGEGIFRVKVYDREGRLVQEPFAQLGAYKGSKPVSLDQAGTYAVAVSAHGAWTLKIE
ncbi:MAG: hypothetical protein JO112_18230 [Planctomycetes bacterium]|nr:hypothetical protein [Planctomycetota bacterium]